MKSGVLDNMVKKKECFGFIYQNSAQRSDPVDENLESCDHSEEQHLAMCLHALDYMIL